jgi:hypothetical protein
MTWPVILALLGVAAAQLVVALLLWRSRNAWPPLPAWTWKDLRQGVALLATVAGAAVLTLLAWWLLDRLYVLLARDVRSPVAVSIADGLVWGLKLLLAGVLGVILSLGLVIGRRQVRLKGPGTTEMQVDGGDEEAPPAPPSA